MNKWHIVVDLEKCVGCYNCLMACKDEFVDNDWPPYTRKQQKHDDKWINPVRHERGSAPHTDVCFVTKMCQHCENAPCQQAHPECVTRREDGVVLIDVEKAKDVKDLVSSCPYGAIYWNEEACTPQKCTMCAHILDTGVAPGMPRCAHSCPTGAIQFYTMEPAEMEKKVADEGLEVYLPELNTKPHVFYKNMYRFLKAFVSGELLKGGECAEGVSVTLKGAGVDEQQYTDCFGEFKFDALEPGDYTLYADGREIKKVRVKESVNVGEIVLD
mgnify:CR=1 FL=1